MRRIAPVTFFLIAASGWASGRAAAEEFASVYTSTASKACRTFDRFKVDGDDYYSRRVCKGVAGYVVVVTEEDLRTTVSVGTSIKAALKEPAAEQGFGSFNSAYDTVEWRFVKGTPKPFAMIQRWSYADNEHMDKSGRPKDVPVLIVTRLPPGPVCHVAQIDVKAGEDANAAARKAADERARTFRCEVKRKKK